MPTPSGSATEPSQAEPAGPANAPLRDHGPRYTETPPNPYAADSRVPAEPWNTVTATLFIVIALAWLVRLRGRFRQFPFLLCCLPILLAGGIGGTLYHGFRTQTAYFLLDILPIQLLALAGAVYLATRLVPPRLTVRLIAATAFVAGAAGFYKVVEMILYRTLPQENRQMAININYASLAVVVLTPMLLVMIRDQFRHVGWVVAGLISFVIAWFFRLLDVRLGVYLPMGSHWLWHSFGAIATACIIEYYYRVEGESSTVRTIH